jgi:predicted GTPase
MNTQATYRQRAVAWLKLLAPWWRVFRRDTAIKELQVILESAEYDVQAARTVFEVEYNRHNGTKTKFQDTCRRLEAEQTQHGVTLDRLNTVLSWFKIEQNLHNGTKMKFQDMCRRLKSEQAQHGTTRAQLKTVLSRMELISSILGTTNEEHSKCADFRKLFREDFLSFANKESFYERKAEAILRMQAVEEELRLLGRVPLFRKKTIVAVAGGFSSGKSSLISSFFDPRFKVSLPIAMEPVTAIPTYIAHSEKTAVIGFPAHGGSVEIDPELFALMRHEFLKALGFDLRRILPFIMLETAWRKQWESLCFIDTPGYNPAKGGGSTAADDTTTADALRQADALLWVLGIDANGEISSDDLEFLRDHGSNLPLAVVVNKADSRPRSQVREVLEQIRDTLDANCIEYRSISAYSSVQGQEYDYEGEPLDEVLGSWNKPSQRDKRLCDEAISVLDAYIEAFKNKIETNKIHKKELHSLKLDLDELGLFDEEEKSSVNKSNESSQSGVCSWLVRKFWEGGTAKERALERLQQLDALFTVEKIEAHIKEAERLRKNMEQLFAKEW